MVNLIRSSPLWKSSAHSRLQCAQTNRAQTNRAQTNHGRWPLPAKRSVVPIDIGNRLDLFNSYDSLGIAMEA
jgi:hypothetical protein